MKFSKFTQYLIFYTLLVILWGAWVRISHSGDGCGDTWPLCNGQLIPEAQQNKTWVEYAHRMMSGIYGFLVLGLYLWARKIAPPKSKVRFWAGLSLFFTITEALLGAKLVLFGLVAKNDSPYRAFIMALHLVNSMMLTGSLALTWDFSKSPLAVKRTNNPFSFEGFSRQRILAGALVSFFVIAVTGAVAALSNTLFPSTSLMEGLASDWDSNSHYLLRLRGLHPLLGLLMGGSLALTAWLSIQMTKPTEMVLKNRSRYLATVTGIGILFGIATLVMLAPIWMKLVHLTIAHSIWIFLVLWVRNLMFESKMESLS